MVVFVDEIAEHVRSLNDGLLGLEKQMTAVERAECVRGLFRAAHSLKGAARSVGVKPIETACHHLEEILAAVRDGSITLGGEHFGVMYASFDAIADAGERLRANRTLADAPIGTIAARLMDVMLGTSRARSTAQAPLVARDAPVPIGKPVDVGMVRVPVAKLDDILSRGGEMLLAGHRLETRVQAVAMLHHLVDDATAEWTPVEQFCTALTRDTAVTSMHDTRLREQVRELLPVIARTSGNLHRFERDLKRLSALLEQDSRVLTALADGLDHEVRNVRMLPLTEACAGLERLVRDLALDGGKDVDLKIAGGDLEVDRSVLEALKDPLIHLVRNAIDHGIETPAERLAAGKPPRSQLTISAALHGTQVEVVVSDDGRGLDVNAIRAKAQSKNLPVPESSAEIAQLIFLPGLSTAKLITEISGRGVGLDVVSSQMVRLGGSVDVTSEVGRGTRFTLALPRALTRLRALLVRDGGRTYAVSSAAITRVTAIRQTDIRTVEGRDVILTGSVPVPIVPLARMLGLASRTSSSSQTFLAVIVAKGQREAAFVVEEFIGEQDVFVKNLGARLGRLGHVIGATIMPDGAVALVLSPASLLEEALGKMAPGLRTASLADQGPPQRKRLLVVDDSVTTRTLIQSVLDTAGYDVTVVVDGAEAWAMLQERDAAIDLIVSDVEMPRMDGFALTQAIRASRHVEDLPVVLVTARSTDLDKARGMEVGASAYLVKSAFDHNVLLDTIAQLL